MQQELIFIPLLIQVTLSLMVWLWMYYLRISEIFKGQIDIQQYGLKSMSNTVASRSEGASDNLVNLFELPVLFYAQCIILYQLQLVDSLYLTLSWLFVGLRIIHSLIHASYNNVMQRFGSYILASLCLWTSWIFMGIDIIKLI